MSTHSDTPRVAPGLDASAREVSLDDAGHLAESTPCRSCGYDLMGMAADGVCPECASAVERSIRGDLLQHCDPAWLMLVGRGLLLVFFGIIGGIMLQFGIMIGAAVAGAMAAAMGATNAMTLVMVSGGLLLALVTLLNVIGVWLITTQDPGRSESEASLSARNVARFAIMATLISAPMQMMMGQTGAFTGGGGGLVLGDVLIMLVALVAALLSLAGWVAFYVYLRQLAFRMPLAWMTRQIRVVMWGYAISTSIALLFGFTSMVLLATGRIVVTGNMTGAASVLALGVSLGSCVSMLAFLVFEGWAAVLCLKLRKRLLAMVDRAAADRHAA